VSGTKNFFRPAEDRKSAVPFEENPDYTVVQPGLCQYYSLYAVVLDMIKYAVKKFKKHSVLYPMLS
jgi:hypothetical protein